MIVLIAEFHAKTGKEDQLETLLKSIVPKVEREPNTIQYVLHRSQSERGCFLFYEKYADKPALDFHCSTPYLKELLSQTEGLLSCAPTISLYDEISAIAR